MVWRKLKQKINEKAEEIEKKQIKQREFQKRGYERQRAKEEKKRLDKKHDMILSRINNDSKAIITLMEFYNAHSDYIPLIPHAKILIFNIFNGEKFYDKDLDLAYIHYNNCFKIKQYLDLQLKKKELKLDLAPGDATLFYASDSRYNYHKGIKSRLNKEIQYIKFLLKQYEKYVPERLGVLALIQIDKKQKEEKKKKQSKKEELIKEIVDRVKEDLSL